MNILIFKRKNVFFVAIAALVLVLLTCIVNVTGAYVIASGRTSKRIPIYCVQTEEKVVNISFDASWGAEKTLKILEVLTEYDVEANFFVVGFWAEKYTEILDTLSKSERMEIGTHSNTHPHMSRLSREQIATELDMSTKIIEDIIGKKITLFRAPFGEYSDTLIEEAEKRGLYTVQWDVDSLDWKGLDAEQISMRVLGRVKCGSIILMHNDGQHTLEALPLILAGLKNKGYKLVRLSSLIYKDNYEIDHTGKQIPKG